MKGLVASNFRRIHKGLLFDIIIMIVSPLLILLFGQLLNYQMIDDGYAASEITMSSVTQYSSVTTKFLYVIEIFRYCGSALCYLLVISGLDEVLKLSASYNNSRRGFLTLILINAIALTIKIVSLITGEGDFYAWSESLYAVIDFLIKIVLGASLFMLLRGNMDVLRSIGEEVAVYRNQTLSMRVAISFPILGIVILADHFAPEMPLGVTVVVFVFMVFAWIYTFIAYLRGCLCAREVARIVSVISEEVIS